MIKIIGKYLFQSTHVTVIELASCHWYDIVLHLNLLFYITLQFINTMYSSACCSCIEGGGISNIASDVYCGNLLQL